MIFFVSQHTPLNNDRKIPETQSHVTNTKLSSGIYDSATVEPLTIILTVVLIRVCFQISGKIKYALFIKR